MLKINFKEIEVKPTFKSTTKMKLDLRENFADLIYTNTSGMRAFKLSEKIYDSEGEIELDDDEEQILFDLINQICTPQIIDAFNCIKESQKSM